MECSVPDGIFCIFPSFLPPGTFRFFTFGEKPSMKTLLLCILCLSTSVLYGQQAVREYRFAGDFKEVSNAGPELQQLCTGNFEQEFLPDYGFTQPVYHFDTNCGFYYDDSLDNFIASGSYTIELYFKLNALNSWKRVIDFKSRTTDRGCYVYNGQLNFYNIATSSSAAPFVADSFSHYVITRDSVTKHVMMYGDGDKFIEFTDNNDDAVYDASKKLRFFQDDLIVRNEAAAGAIALLRIYNYAMDSVTVRQTYNGLSSALGVGNTTSEASCSIHPNPVRDAVMLSLPGNGLYRYMITDAGGRVLLQGQVAGGRSTIDMAALPTGMYVLRLQGEGNMFTRKLIRQ
jgi:hypothetical protein